MTVLWSHLSTALTLGAASFTIYTRTKEYFRDHNLLVRDNIFDVSATGGIGSVSWFTYLGSHLNVFYSGALSGSLISFGSARK